MTISKEELHAPYDSILEINRKTEDKMKKINEILSESKNKKENIINSYTTETFKFHEPVQIYTPSRRDIFTVAAMNALLPLAIKYEWRSEYLANMIKTYVDDILKSLDS